MWPGRWWRTSSPTARPGEFDDVPARGHWMKIALVSPYDFTWPGGVTAHISQLSHRLTDMGHSVKILAPFSPSRIDGQGAELHPPRPQCAHPKRRLHRPHIPFGLALPAGCAASSARRSSTSSTSTSPWPPTCPSQCSNAPTPSTSAPSTPSTVAPACTVGAAPSSSTGSDASTDASPYPRRPQPRPTLLPPGLHHHPQRHRP